MLRKNRDNAALTVDEELVSRPRTDTLRRFVLEIQRHEWLDPLRVPRAYETAVCGRHVIEACSFVGADTVEHQDVGPSAADESQAARAGSHDDRRSFDLQRSQVHRDWFAGSRRRRNDVRHCEIYGLGKGARTTV